MTETLRVRVVVAVLSAAWMTAAREVRAQTALTPAVATTRPAATSASTENRSSRRQGPPGAILGYINHIPPELPEAREARHKKVAERRKHIPILVHRGDRKSAPENTLEAYAAAMDLGADGVEIDIRRSRDGVLYLYHDDDLGRTAHGSGRVRDLSYYELLRATPKEVYGSATRQTRPPTLPAFLALARHRAMLLHLDVKEPGLQDEIARLLDEADMWDHIVEVNTGNAERLRSHPKVKLKRYKGWWPEGQYENDPDAIQRFLQQDGNMVFTKDPRAAVKWFKRPVRDPQPLPKYLRAFWTPEGPSTSPG